MSKGKSMSILLVIIMIVGGILIVNNKEKVNQDYDIFLDETESKIVLYFSNMKTGELTKEYRVVNIENIKDDMPNTIINELLKGPGNEELTSTIPNETKVNSIVTEENKIIVDFSEEYARENEDELQNLHKIYSVVNSITEITEINEVEIKVNGEIIASKKRL